MTLVGQESCTHVWIIFLSLSEHPPAERLLGKERTPIAGSRVSRGGGMGSKLHWSEFAGRKDRQCRSIGMECDVTGKSWQNIDQNSRLSGHRSLGQCLSRNHTTAEQTGEVGHLNPGEMEYGGRTVMTRKSAQWWNLTRPMPRRWFLTRWPLESN